MEKLKRLDKIALAVFIIAFAIRIAYLAILLSQSPMDKIASAPPDTIRYIQLATDLSNFGITNESNLYMVGFGYSFFLAVLFLLSGKALLFSLICQIVVAAISTVFLYKIGLIISGNRLYGLLAATINAISPTALSLNTSFLSETVFFACMILSIYVYLRAINNPSIKKCLLLGALITYAAFTRSVGQFLPIVIFAAVLLTPSHFLTIPKKKIILSITISMLLSVFLLMAWAYRNYKINDSFTVAGTGPGAAAMYLGTRIAAERSDTLSILYFRDAFGKEWGEWMINAKIRGNGFEWFTNKVIALFKEDPVSFVRTYMLIVWENMMAPDQISWYRMPDYKKKLVYYSQLGEIYCLNKILFALSVVGIILLLINGKVAPAILLILLYIYFALISGFTYWQGSRIFYPAQAAGVFLVSAAVYYPSLYLYGRLRRMNRARSNQLISSLGTGTVKVIYYPNRIFHFGKSTYNKIISGAIAVALIIFSITSVIPALQRPVYLAVGSAGNTTFGGQIVLSQVRLEEKNGATRAVLFDLYPVIKIDENYRFFLHLTPVTGGKMVNYDFAPDPPMTEWKPYYMTTQRRNLHIAPGEYTVLLGVFYNIKKHLGDPISFKITVK